MPVTRRLVLTGLALTPVALAMPALADEAPLRPGWTIDWSACPPDRLAAVRESLGRQIDLVESVRMDEAVKAEFRDIPLIVVADLGQPGRYRMGRLELNARPQPPENPVLLHELLHAWHFRRQNDPTVTGPIRAAYAQARASGDWPADSYMLSNPQEFFAMCASVVLWGRAARPPSTRDAVREKLPEFYAFVVERFRLTL